MVQLSSWEENKAMKLIVDKHLNHNISCPRVLKYNFNKLKLCNLFSQHLQNGLTHIKTL